MDSFNVHSEVTDVVGPPIAVHRPDVKSGSTCRSDDRLSQGTACQAIPHEEHLLKAGCKSEEITAGGGGEIQHPWGWIKVRLTRSKENTDERINRAFEVGHSVVRTNVSSGHGTCGAVWSGWVARMPHHT